ncbi:MAG: hypothetical protein ACO2PM_00580 [Pyrobaculum sp.]|jgi:hypothetical protein
MGRVEALGIPGVRAARRCWLSVRGVDEDEVIVVDAGEFYAVGTVLDKWFIVDKDAVRRFLAALLGVEEGKIELRC